MLFKLHTKEAFFFPHSLHPKELGVREATASPLIEGSDLSKFLLSGWQLLSMYYCNTSVEHHTKGLKEDISVGNIIFYEVSLCGVSRVITIIIPSRYNPH